MKVKINGRELNELHQQEERYFDIVTKGAYAGGVVLAVMGAFILGHFVWLITKGAAVVAYWYPY